MLNLIVLGLIVLCGVLLVYWLMNTPSRREEELDELFWTLMLEPDYSPNNYKLNFPAKPAPVEAKPIPAWRQQQFVDVIVYVNPDAVANAPDWSIIQQN